MIVLDTNVVSELAKPNPSKAVIDWVDVHNSADLMITALTAAEVRAGVALLPPGRRQREIGLQMEALLTETFNQPWTGNTQRLTALPAWVNAYNTERAHTALGGHPPISRLTAA